MSTPVHPFSDLPQGVKATCDRLLYPSARGEERARQERLLLVLLASAVLVTVATAQVVVWRMGASVALAAIPMVFGIGLIAPSVLIATGRRGLVEPAALILGAVAAAFLIAAGGGLASPLAIMSAAFVVEAGWVARTRAALGAGLATAIVSLATAVGLGATVLADAAATPPSPWQWFVPLIYVGTLLVRVPFAGFVEKTGAGDPKAPSVADMIGATVLRLNRAGEVIEASPAAERLLGVAPEMLLGSGLFDRVHLADRIAYLEALTDLKQGDEAAAVSLRLRMAAEPNAPVSVFYRPCTLNFAAGPGGEEFVAVLRDNEAAAELEHAIAQTRQAAENAALTRDRLLASVSHELRTPLNAIVGFSDLLGSGMAGELANEKQQEYVELIRAAGGHLLSVVNAILDMSKLQAGSYTLDTEPFSFEEAVRLCTTMMAQQADAKSVALKTEISDDVGMVHSDRRAVQQVLLNLLSNAVKFTPSGEVTVKARRDGDRLDFTVSDTGIGISADDLQRIGTPFMQVQNDYTRQYEGTGLGLALVKGLVERLGGGISIESAPGSGTRVHVSLPAASADEEIEKEELRAVAGGADWNNEWNYDGLRKTA